MCAVRCVAAVWSRTSSFADSARRSDDATAEAARSRCRPWCDMATHVRHAAELPQHPRASPLPAPPNRSNRWRRWSPLPSERARQRWKPCTSGSVPLSSSSSRRPRVASTRSATQRGRAAGVPGRTPGALAPIAARRRNRSKPPTRNRLLRPSKAYAEGEEPAGTLGARRRPRSPPAHASRAAMRLRTPMCAPAMTGASSRPHRPPPPPRPQTRSTDRSLRGGWRRPPHERSTRRICQQCHARRADETRACVSAYAIALHRRLGANRLVRPLSSARA